MNPKDSPLNWFCSLDTNVFLRTWYNIGFWQQWSYIFQPQEEAKAKENRKKKKPATYHMNFEHYHQKIPSELGVSLFTPSFPRWPAVEFTLCFTCWKWNTYASCKIHHFLWHINMFTRGLWETWSYKKALLTMLCWSRPEALRRLILRSNNSSLFIYIYRIIPSGTGEG